VRGVILVPVLGVAQLCPWIFVAQITLIVTGYAVLIYPLKMLLVAGWCLIVRLYEMLKCQKQALLLIFKLFNVMFSSVRMTEVLYKNFHIFDLNLDYGI